MFDVDFSKRWSWKALPPQLSAVGVDLSSAKFDCLRISGKFREVFAYETEFVSSAISGADFSKSDVSFARFDGAVLSSASFNSADASTASFENARLSGVSFKGADLENASFENAEIRGADFSQTNLTGVNFSGASFNTVRYVSAPSAFGLTQAQLDKAWAFEDAPPEGLEKFDPPLKIGTLCERPSEDFLDEMFGAGDPGNRFNHGPPFWCDNYKGPVGFL